MNSSSGKINKILTFFAYISPVLFVLGNPFINLFVIVICLTFYYVHNYIKIVDKKLIWLLVGLSIIFLISSLSSNYVEYSLFKSFTYIRFFIFLIIFPILLIKININIKNLGLAFSLITFFVVIDSYIQLFFGKDIFGYPYDYAYSRMSGPFGEELIVGNYVFYFSFLSLSFLLKEIKFSNFFLILTFIFIGIFCFASGERNTFLGYLIFMFFLFFLSKKKILVFTSSILVILIAIVLFFNVNKLNEKYKINNIVGSEQKKLSSNVLDDDSQDLIKNRSDNSTYQQPNFINLKNKIYYSVWFAHYRAGLRIFEENKIFGSGFKTFRYYCPDRFSDTNLRQQEHIICTTHPHNIYIELLSDTGLVGLLFFLLISFYFIIISIKNNYRSNDLSTSIIICLLITYLFPFKPHGSLFSTSSAYIFWFVFSILIFNILDKQKNK
jgi:O-antigen ligase